MDEKLVIQITAEIADLKKQLDDAKKEIDKMAEDTKKSTKKMDEAFKKAGDAISKGLKTAVKAGAAALATLGASMVAVVASTEEYRTAQAKLSAAFDAAGKSADEATASYNGLYRFLGDTDVSVEAANHLAQLTLTQEENEAMVKTLQGVYATFGDSLPIEGLTEAINHTAKLGEVQGPLADALEWQGITTDEFNKKLAACNSERERELLILETLGAEYGGAAESYEKYAAEILRANEAQAQLDSSMAAIGTALQPIITDLKILAADVLTQLTPVIQTFVDEYLPVIRDVLGEIVGKLGEAVEWISQHTTLLGVLGGIILTIVAAIGLYNTVAAVKAAMAAVEATSVWGLCAAYAAQAAAMIVAIAPYVLIVAAIAAVIAIIVLCVKHWDEILAVIKKVVSKIVEVVKGMAEGVGNFFSNMGNKISTTVSNIKEKVVGVFTNIKESITGKIRDAKDTVLGIFDNIKSGISNKINAAKDTVGNVINKIKGFFNFKFSWPKIPMPHFGISPSGWKVGDLLKGSIPKLSISWYQQGGIFDKPTLFGYGNGMLGGLGENGAEAVVPLEKNTQWLDRIAERLKGDGTPVYLVVDGKVLAHTTCDNINSITRQTGKMPLKLV